MIQPDRASLTEAGRQKSKIEYPGYPSGDRVKSKAEKFIWWSYWVLKFGPIVLYFVFDYYGAVSEKYDPIIAISVLIIWPLILVYIMLNLLKRVAGVPAPVENVDACEKQRRRRFVWIERFSKLLMMVLLYGIIFRQLRPELQAWRVGFVADTLITMLAIFPIVLLALATERLIKKRFAAQ